MKQFNVKSYETRVQQYEGEAKKRGDQSVQREPVVSCLSTSPGHAINAATLDGGRMSIPSLQRTPPASTKQSHLSPVRAVEMSDQAQVAIHDSEGLNQIISSHSDL